MRKTLKIDVDVSMYTSVETVKDSGVIDEIVKKSGGYFGETRRESTCQISR